MTLNNKKILITGASGFIGGRIIERLSLQSNVEILALVHSLEKAVRIARFDLEIIQGDVLNKKLLNSLTKNVDYVIHCAVGNTGDVEVNHTITVEGTRNIANACLKNKVKRLIYFSTMSVYGYPLPSKVNEETPYKKVAGDHYNNDKIQAEAIVRNKIKQGLAAVILQPTIVYGPYAGSWTIGPVTEIKTNSLLLVNDGAGLANPLYIDNLVDAVFLSMTSRKAIGQTFIISDGKTTTWRKFYQKYTRMLGDQPIVELNRFNKVKYTLLYLPINLARLIRNKFNLLKKRPAWVDKWIMPIYNRREGLKTIGANSNRQIFFKDKATFSITKANQLLNYKPRIFLDDGMKLTKKWLGYARYL